MNKAFQTENVFSGSPKGLTDALRNDTTSQAETDAFGASRKLLESPSKSKNPVRNALDEAALKLSSVGTSLQDMTPRARRAAGDEEWTLSTENPVFSEVNTPREHSQNTSAKNTPAKERNVTSPSSSRPHTASAPGSAQKEAANVFPRSFPVKESDADDFPGASSGGLGDVVVMFVALILVVGVLFLVPTTSLPSSVSVPLENFRLQAATSPAGANLVALADKMPQSIPRLTSTNFPLSDLRYRAASTFHYFSSGRNAVQQYKTARQIAVAAVQTPLKVLGFAIAGVCLAVAMVAAVLQLHGAMPLSALAANLGSFSKGGGGVSLGGEIYTQNDMELIMEEEQQPTRVRRVTKTRRTSTRRANSATPNISRRMVSDDAERSGGGSKRGSTTRKSSRRQTTA